MRLQAAALTLALGLGAVGLAPAQESGNWVTRLFAPADKSAEAKKAEVEAPKASAASKRRLQQAKADLERRQEVCMKIRETAVVSGDEDLRQKAEQLDQRAWDLYVAITNRIRTSERPIGEVSARAIGLTKGGGK